MAICNLNYVLSLSLSLSFCHALPHDARTFITHARICILKVEPHSINSNLKGGGVVQATAWGSSVSFNRGCGSNDVVVVVCRCWEPIANSSSTNLFLPLRFQENTNHRLLIQAQHCIARPLTPPEVFFFWSFTSTLHVLRVQMPQHQQGTLLSLSE